MNAVNQHKIQAVIFDLDGLMICSEPVAYLVWRDLVESFGSEFSSSEYRQLIGGTPEESARWIMETKKLDIDIAELLERYWATRTRTVIEQVGLEPGVRELLADLQALGLPLAVASNSRRGYLEGVLTALEVHELFSAICSFDDVAHGKPAPDLFLAAASALGTAPRRCLVFEDSPVGLEAALRAGMRCVVVPNKELSDADFSGAYASFTSIVDLREQLEALLV